MRKQGTRHSYATNPPPSPPPSTLFTHSLTHHVMIDRDQTTAVECCPSRLISCMQLHPSPLPCPRSKSTCSATNTFLPIWVGDGSIHRWGRWVLGWMDERGRCADKIFGKPPKKNNQNLVLQGGTKLETDIRPDALRGQVVCSFFSKAAAASPPTTLSIGLVKE